MKTFENSNRSEWENIVPITINNISEVPFDNILFFVLAADGAMGEPGRISLFEARDNQLYHYRGSRYEYRANEKKYVDSGLTDEVIKDSLKFSFNDWEEVYLGHGNILYVKKELYKSFQEITDECSPAKIYALLPEIVMETIKTERKH